MCKSTLHHVARDNTRTSLVLKTTKASLTYIKPVFSLDWNKIISKTDAYLFSTWHIHIFEDLLTGVFQKNNSLSM